MSRTARAASARTFRAPDQFADSKTYVPDAPPGSVTGEIGTLTLQANDELDQPHHIRPVHRGVLTRRSCGPRITRRLIDI
ncbi:MAG: hypothetical protein ACREXJ_14085 [Gammaproteobacteria bacterium]